MTIDPRSRRMRQVAWENCKACALQMVGGPRCYVHNPVPAEESPAREHLRDELSTLTSDQRLQLRERITSMAQQPPQTRQNAVTLWDRTIPRVRVYEADAGSQATIEHMSDLIGETVLFVKTIREAQSEYGRSVLVGIIRKNADQTDTVWVNEKTTLYRQIIDELKKGAFVAAIYEFESKAHPGQTYYTLADPRTPQSEIEEKQSDNGLEDLPF